MFLTLSHTDTIAFDQSCINIDFAHVIDQKCNFELLIVGKQVTKKSGFAGAQKSGQKGDRKFIRTFASCP